MSSNRGMDIKSFFSTVKKKHHQANLVIQGVRDDMKDKADAQQRAQRRAEIDEARERNRESARMRRNEARRVSQIITEDLRTDEEKVQDEIDGLVEDADVTRPVAEKKKRKLWQIRPPNWQDIAYDATVYGNDSALQSYMSEFDGVPPTAAYQRLNTWKKDLKSGKIAKPQMSRIPVYGSKIDDLVLADFHTARSVGLSVDDETLRRSLVLHLIKAGKQGLLKEEGGKHTFGHSWAIRFYRRHGLVLLVCTTKMREKPADFDEKREKYLKIGAQLLFLHNIPPQLVINGDETAVMLVNRAKVTRNTAGAKRVRVLGMGEDKAQITASIFVTEAGDVLPTR